MTETLKTISPVDGRIYVERPLETGAGIDRALGSAQAVQFAWGSVPLATRCEILGRAVDGFVAKAGDIAAEITWQMGRPIRHTPGEIRGFEERARHMLGIAAQALVAVRPGDNAGFQGVVSGPGAASPLKFTMMFWRRRPRKRGGSVRDGPSTSTS